MHRLLSYIWPMLLLGHSTPINKAACTKFTSVPHSGHQVMNASASWFMIIVETKYNMRINDRFWLIVLNWTQIAQLCPFGTCSSTRRGGPIGRTQASHAEVRSIISCRLVSSIWGYSDWVGDWVIFWLSERLGHGTGDSSLLAGGGLLVDNRIWTDGFKPWSNQSKDLKMYPG